MQFLQKVAKPAGAVRARAVHKQAVKPVLVSVTALNTRLPERSQISKVHVAIDASSAELYARAHIPEARLWPEAPAAKDPLAPLHVMPANAFEQALARLRIRPDQRVVVYDSGNMMYAARLWWVFRYYGFNAVQVLDGGWPAWVQQNTREGRPRVAIGADTSSEHAPVPDPPFKAVPRPELLMTTEQLLAAVEAGATTSSASSSAGGQEGLQVIDSRTPGEYAGTDTRGNARGGHVPGAVNIPHASLLHAPTGQLKPAAELKQLFESKGIDLAKPCVTYCQAGIRAALGALALSHAGARAVANYDASMGAWLNTPGYPIDKPRQQQ